MVLRNSKIARVTESKTGQALAFRKLGKSRRALITLFLVVVAVVLSAGAYYYLSRVAPFRQPVLTVDGTVIRMDYFLKRVRTINGDPAAVLEQLVYEQIIKTVVPQYGIEVSQSDVEQAIRNSAATASNINTVGSPVPAVTSQITDISFEEWYSQQLKTTGLSDAEYREIIHTNLLATRFSARLADSIPATTEQVHLNVMALATLADAERAKAKIYAGESFADVASELSIDEVSKVNGGDLGWIPRGVVPFDDVVFQLDVGKVSGPVALESYVPSSSQYALFMVSEKDPNRSVEARMVKMLSYQAFYNWLRQEIPHHVIEYNISAENQAWASEQLAKAPKK